MEKINRVLVLAPHPDDGEFGCGGTLKKLSESGATIFYTAFSPCIKSLPEGLPEETLYIELKKAVTHLGIEASNVKTFNYPVRELIAHRQQILEDLVKLNKEIIPELVFIPSSDDIHQDHLLINREGMRVFKNTRLLGYELPWNNFKLSGNYFVELEKPHIEAKIMAINEYKSQVSRNYNTPDFFYAFSKVRGTQIKREFAECFELIRWID